MSLKNVLARVLPITSDERKLRGARVLGAPLAKVLPTAWRNARRSRFATVLIPTLIFALAAAAVSIPLFKVYSDDSGTLLSATADSTLDKNSKFFDAGLGNNDQACVTCHQPFDGFTISVESVQDAFQATNGTDPLFRFNDTANDPNSSKNFTNSVQDKLDAYSLFLDLGVVRIGKAIPGTANFTIEHQDSATFGDLPKTDDPQNLAAPTLSCFRRPLINTNVHLDSSVLWDGRTATPTAANMRAQVGGAVRTLLLGPTPSDADADDVAKFMLGVFTDQVSDTAAGNLASGGATGGVDNLLAQAQACTAPNCPQPGGNTVFTIYDAWSTLSPTNARNVARVAIAHGQQVFDSHGCKGCHNASNLGNNSSATFFARIGTDSLDIVDHLIAGDGVVGGSDPHPHPELATLRSRIAKLPVYCLRPNTDTTPFSEVPCGTDPINHSGDVRTTDPGRALVSGQISDVGKFKPPILRALGVRSPYFHNGAAASIEDLVDFYNARFNFGLTAQEKADLAAFLESL